MKGLGNLGGQMQLFKVWRQYCKLNDSLRDLV